MKFNNSISDTFIQNVSDPKNKFSKNVMPIFRAFGIILSFMAEITWLNSIQFNSNNLKWLGEGVIHPFSVLIKENFVSKSRSGT